MNDKQKVCVVHIETRRFFDDCQNSYLPVMYPIFGVFSTRETAEKPFGIISRIDLRSNSKSIVITLTQKGIDCSMTYVLREKIKYLKDTLCMASIFI